MRPQKTLLATLAIRVMTIVAGLLLLWMADSAAFAQLDHGSFVGTIADSTGAGVPQATVQVTNIDTGIVDVLLSCTATATTSPVINDDDFTLYPNPSTGKFIVECNNMKDDCRDLEFYNALGEKVFAVSILSSAKSYEIDFSSQTSGVYLARAYSNGNTFEQKILIEK